MKEIRQAIVDEARTWLGTPWAHQQRRKGVAVDCAGVVAEVLKARGLSTFDMRGYDRLPDGSMLDVLRREATEIPIATMQPGDMVAMKFDRGPSHIGLVGDYPYGEGNLSVIHANNSLGKVCEHRITAEWKLRIVAAFRLPGVPA